MYNAAVQQMMKNWMFQCVHNTTKQYDGSNTVLQDRRLVV